MSRIRAILEGRSLELEAAEGQTLLDCLRQAGLSVPAPCGGQGRCGKCLVEIEQGGERRRALACQLVPQGDMKVYLSAAGGGELLSGGSEPVRPYPPREGLGLALDLGTTTMAMSLVDLSTGEIMASGADWCCLAPYGADVIARCRQAMDGRLPEMTDRLRRQALTMARELEAQAGRPGELREIYAAGNTVMEHIFMGLDPSGLARAPFQGESLFREDRVLDLEGIELRCAPCAAAYVGGDIMAGILASGLDRQEGMSLFLDVGTNGEMALGGREGFTLCSVACGPAFEGAGIGCGMPSLPGAVRAVGWEDGPAPDVIGGGEAKGLCGSGLISLLALLLDKGIVDQTGRLLGPGEAPPGCDKWLREDENGNGIFILAPGVELRAQDVRSLQLAKAAVAAGIELMLGSRGLAPGDLNGLYLAGGFGRGLDLEAAARISMLPREIVHRAKTLGNTSLRGAALALADLRARDRLVELAAQGVHIELSLDGRFNDAFIDHMSFDEEERIWN